MSFIKNTLLYFLLFSFALIACSDDDAPRNDREILVGMGIEGILIGNSVNDAIDILGKRYAEFSFGQPGLNYSYTINYDQYGVQVNLDPAPEDTDITTLDIRELVLDAPFKGKTPEGIGIGSSKTDVESTYPGGTGSFFDDYAVDGIAFDYDDEDKVELIRVKE